MSRTLPAVRRLGAALLVAAAVALTVAPPAGAAATADPAKAGGGWVGRQFTSGGWLVGQFGPDAGLTVDGVLALAAAKVGATTSTKATDWLQTQVGSYAAFTDTSTTPSTTTWYAGGLGKLLLAAHVAGVSPTAFGGVDLVQHLQDLECTPARVTATECTADQLGLYVDKGVNAYGSVTYQAYALLGLAAAGVTPSPAAIAYLTGQECSGGGFQNDHRAPAAACAPDTDVTAFAVQALYAVGSGPTAASSLSWLAGRQNSNGSFAGTGPTATPNSNTTAVAAQALSLSSSYDAAVAKALGYIRSLQVGCSATAANRGAIGYQSAVVTNDTLRASVQAVPALAGATIGSVTNSGAAAGLPDLACAAPRPAPSVTPPATGGGTPAPVDEDLTDNGSVLARTGASPLLPLTGMSLVLGGAVLLVLTRRPPRRR
ncbi:MAG: hypothetical protein QOJ90_3072 [Actinomycetota bacterium]|jgi:hypothetical protein|nr:hypothetical protein [Actinomycetota bacterium]